MFNSARNCQNWCWWWSQDPCTCFSEVYPITLSYLLTFLRQGLAELPWLVFYSHCGLSRTSSCSQCFLLWPPVCASKSFFSLQVSCCLCVGASASLANTSFNCPGLGSCSSTVSLEVQQCRSSFSLGLCLLSWVNCLPISTSEPIYQ